MTNTTLSAEVVREVGVFGGNSRDIAAWAGRKLSNAQLQDLAQAHSKGERAFKRLTNQLFRSKRCASDERLQALLVGKRRKKRRREFREALWIHVVPAIGEYTDHTCSQRVALYLQDLSYLSLVDSENTLSVGAFEEVAA